MFDPTKEVPTLELCRKLKELGYPQDRDWLVWVKYKELPDNKGGDILYEQGEYILTFGWEVPNEVRTIKASTARELGKWLPERIETSDDTYSLVIEKYDDGWTVEYKSYNPYSIEPFDSLIIISADTLSYTMGLMLEWLVENGYVNFKKGEKMSKLNKLFKEYRWLVIKQAELEIEAKSLDEKMAEIVEKSGLTGLDFLKEYYKWLKTLKEER